MLLPGSYAGIPWGPDTDIHLQEIEGLDLPEVLSSDVQRALDHGMRVGRDLLGGRTVTISFALSGNGTMVGFDATALEFSKLYLPQRQEQPLYFDGNRKVIFCRPRRGRLTRTFTDQQKIGFGVIEYVATDPRIYSADELSGAFPLAVVAGGPTGGGTSWPWTWPHSWLEEPDPEVPTTPGVGGTVQVFNNGTFETPWLGRFEAGTNYIHGPRIENITTGDVLDFTSLVLQPGQFLTIDSYERTAYLNGEQSRYGTLSSESRWFNLLPGPNEMRAGARQVAAGSEFRITYRSAWI